MNIFKKVSFLIILLSGLTAWADDKDYADHVAPYLGEYTGKFDGEKGTIRLSMVDNELMAEFYTADGATDLVPGCGAMIGSVAKVDVDKDDGAYIIDSATFDFDAGRCSRRIEGHEIKFDFKHKDGMVSRVNLSILEYTETRYDNCYDRGYPYPGYPGGYPYPYPGYPGRGYCPGPSVYPHYMSGKFTK